MEQLQFRSLLEHPEYREPLLENVKNNSDWGFLYGWLEARLAELGRPYCRRSMPSLTDRSEWSAIMC